MDLDCPKGVPIKGLLCRMIFILSFVYPSDNGPRTSSINHSLNCNEREQIGRNAKILNELNGNTSLKSVKTGRTQM